ncbi:GerAB/ArcD/ProY family transporter [Evansella halocellulosilytica]|uniref:GerAB/ArcD/ProY family transporter n=1 Tax=Evansella halocellulosilytica TaxID=2011013 RepID=UPI000BB968B5|nr:GerAB/ArcD/ProY family transporter [Evansella halocellulosilytica]
MNQAQQQSAYQIGNFEMCVSLIAMILGTGIIVLPRGLAAEMDTTDGWISLIISNLIIIFLIFLIVRLQKQYPGRTIIQYLAEGKVGKWISKLLALSFVLYFACITAYLCRFLTIVLNIYLLPETPNEVLMLLLLLLSTYGASKGVQGIVHLNLMFTPFVIFGALGILVFEIPNIDINYFRPVLAEGIKPVALGLKETTFAFLGIEILFFFMAYMKASELRPVPFMVTNTFITFLYLIILLMTYGIFDLNMTKQVTFPLIELVKEVNIPGEFFERAEPFFVTIWLMTMFNTFSLSQMLSTRLLKREFLLKVKKMWVSSFFVFIVFILAFLPKSIVELGVLSDLISYMGVLNITFSLLFGYITVWFRRRKSRMNRKEVQG